MGNGHPADEYTIPVRSPIPGLIGGDGAILTSDGSPLRCRVSSDLHLLGVSYLGARTIGVVS